MPLPLVTANALGMPKSGGSTTNAPSSDNYDNAMVKIVGGTENWYKLFPAKAGNWTQAFTPQVKAMEGGSVPSMKGRSYVDQLALSGKFQVTYYVGQKTGAGYAYVLRKGPGGVKLFA